MDKYYYLSVFKLITMCDSNYPLCYCLRNHPQTNVASDNLFLPHNLKLNKTLHFFFSARDIYEKNESLVLIFGKKCYKRIRSDTTGCFWVPLC